MADEKHGIKETKDLLKAAEELVLKGLELAEDGYQGSDLIELIMDSEVQSDLVAALQGATEVDDEIEDLSIREGFELQREASDIAENIVLAVVEGQNTESE